MMLQFSFSLTFFNASITNLLSCEDPWLPPSINSLNSQLKVSSLLPLIKEVISSLTGFPTKWILSLFLSKDWGNPSKPFLAKCTNNLFAEPATLFCS